MVHVLLDKCRSGTQCNIFTLLALLIKLQDLLGSSEATATRMFRDSRQDSFSSSTSGLNEFA